VTEKEVADQVKDLHGKMVQDRAAWDLIYQEVTDYVLPRLSAWDLTQAPQPSKRGSRNYDSAAQRAHRMASDGYQGYLFPRNSEWFRQQFSNRQVMQMPRAKQLVQSWEEDMYAELEATNFYEQAGEAVDIGLATGTATVFTENDEDTERTAYTTLHPREAFISVNRIGRVDTVLRDFWLTNRSIISAFGEEQLRKTVGENRLKTMKKAPFTMARVLHFCGPRKDRTYGIETPDNMPWASVYVLHDGYHLLRNSGYLWNPYVVYRYRVQSGEIYGWSPGIEVLIDAITASEAARSNMIMGQLKVEPTIAVPDDMEDFDFFRPRAVMRYRNPERLPKVLEVTGDYAVSVDQVNRIEAAVQQKFHADVFALLSTLSQNQKTAREVMEIAGEKAAMLSPFSGRMETDLTDPLLDRTFLIMYHNGRLEQAPPELEGQMLKTRYVGPLAQIQQNYFQTRTTLRAIANAQLLLEVFGDRSALDIVKQDQLMERVLTDGGLDQDLIREEREVFEIRQGRLQQIAQEQQMQVAERMSKLMPNLGKKIEEGSAIKPEQSQGVPA
jgi:hypothetical protein